MDHYNLISLGGIFGLMLFAWALSSNRRHINLRVIVWGVGLQLGLGAAIGWRLLDLLPVLPPPGHFAAPPQLEFAALMVGASAIAVLLRVRPRDLPVVLLASIFAFYGAKLGALLLGSGLGALVGGLSVGLFSNLQARLREVPAAVAATPGILLLVPGSMGFQGVEAFLQQHTLVGVNAAFETCMVGASLVGGLLLAHALLPPRRAPAAFRSQQRPL